MDSKKQLDPLQGSLDKLELRVEVMLQNMQIDLTTLVHKYKSVEDPRFQRELLLIIGANSREVSQLVIKAYQSERMLVLDKLINTTCSLGPKMD